MSNNKSKKLNLGLMDDIDLYEKEKLAQDTLLNQQYQNVQKSHQNTSFNHQKSKNNFYPTSSLQQTRLDSFVDFSQTNNQNYKPQTKQKKLFQNLDDFSFKKELNIKIFGIGGAGNNMVRYIANNSNIRLDSLYAINTDYQVLKKMPSGINVVLIGDKITNGYGSGSDPEIGKKSALESEELIRDLLEDTDLLFIVSGMGKGTGTGASPFIAKLAQEMGIMTLALVNLPSISNEGEVIYNRGQEGLKKLRREVNGILTISNEKLFNETDANVTLEKAFNYANSVICNVIYEIINLITTPAQVNVDFNDVKTFFKQPIVFQVNTFDFLTHENIEEQINEQLQNLIYQDNIEGARKAIVNFKLNPNVSRDIVNNVTKALMKITKNNQLEITFSIDYFENIECARVSILLAMNRTDEPDIQHNDCIKQSSLKQKINKDHLEVEYVEIINTKNDKLEKKSKTIELTTNRLSNQQSTMQKNHPYPQSIFKNTLEGWEELQNELHLNEGCGYDQKRQEIRRNFIPTKKLQNEPKTIQFEHKTGPKNY